MASSIQAKHLQRPHQSDRTPSSSIPMKKTNFHLFSKTFIITVVGSEMMISRLFLRVYTSPSNSLKEWKRSLRQIQLFRVNSEDLLRKLRRFSPIGDFLSESRRLSADLLSKFSTSSLQSPNAEELFLTNDGFFSRKTREKKWNQQRKQFRKFL